MASSCKRKRRSSGSQSDATDGTDADEIEWLRDLKRVFDHKSMSADELLNKMPDPESRTEMWQQITGMNTAFAQLVSKATALIITGPTKCADLIHMQTQELENRQEKILALEEHVKRLRHELYPTEGTPIDCLQRIISFCDLRDVCRSCIRVNRDWQEAAIQDLKTRKKVDIRCLRSRGTGIDELFVMERQKRNKDSERRLLVASVVKSLMLMTGLQEIRITDYKSELIEALVPVLNASSCLLSLKLKGCSFPTGLSSPRLKSLSADPVALTASALIQLPLITMQKLDISARTDAEVIDLLSGMKSLTHLSLKLQSPPIRNVTCYGVKLMLAFEHLTEFEMLVGASSASAAQVDAAVAELVRRNPGLEVLSFGNLVMSDASLNSISRLMHLKKISIASRIGSFTYHALLRLLTHGLQHGLQEAEITGAEITVSQRATISQLIESHGVSCNINAMD